MNGDNRVKDINLILKTR